MNKLVINTFTNIPAVQRPVRCRGPLHNMPECEVISETFGQLAWSGAAAPHTETRARALRMCVTSFLHRLQIVRLPLAWQTASIQRDDVLL